MTGQQKTVLWIGLILVGLNLVSQWKEISAVIFQGSGITGGILGGGSDSGGGFHLPTLPLPGLLTTPTTKTKTTLM